MKFSEFVKESAETISRLKANEGEKRYAKSNGMDRVGKDMMGDKTRYRYSGKPVDKGDHSYHSHMQYKRGHQDQRHSDVETTYTKATHKDNGIERSTIDRKTHGSVRDAVNHLTSLSNYHKNKS